MKTDPVEPADPLNLLRQQLLLAQVRLMELEDARDELAPKAAEAAQQLAAAQLLVDQKSDEAAHLAKTLAELQAQYDYLRHMQHVTNEALTDARKDLVKSATQLADAQQRVTQLQRETVALADQNSRLSANLQQTSRELSEENSVATARLIRNNELDAEIRSLKSSRSWRWSGWLRSLEKFFGGPRS